MLLLSVWKRSLARPLPWGFSLGSVFISEDHWGCLFLPISAAWCCFSQTVHFTYISKCSDIVSSRYLSHVCTIHRWPSFPSLYWQTASSLSLFLEACQFYSSLQKVTFLRLLFRAVHSKIERLCKDFPCISCLTHTKPPSLSTFPPGYPCCSQWTYTDMSTKVHSCWWSDSSGRTPAWQIPQFTQGLTVLYLL
jgi:hypothetical protein